TVLAQCQETMSYCSVHYSISLQVQKKTKRKKARTLDETEGDENDEEGKSKLIQIPDNLLTKTSRSMLKPPSAENLVSRQMGPKAEHLIESNSAFIDGIARKGWPLIAADFLREHRDMTTPTL
ncbi:hypothetical protein PFISCL1PPCAC_25225, partial [Pristionchus fissidentatus]